MYTEGSIFVESWGYGQTNVNFYQVVKETPKSVVLREIGATVVEGNGWEDLLKPVKDRFRIGTEEFRCMKNASGSVKVRKWGSWAQPWDGKPERRTDLQRGH